jgi:hypothetical protein
MGPYIGEVALQEKKVQLEVNGQTYFVNFESDDGQWHVIAPSVTGLLEIPVVEDAADYRPFRIVMEPSEDEEEIIN